MQQTAHGDPRLIATLGASGLPEQMQQFFHFNWIYFRVPFAIPPPPTNETKGS